MYLAQYDYKQIAEITGYTKEYVNQIVASAKGQSLVEEFQDQVRAKLFDKLQDRFESIAELALDAIEKTLKADIAPVHKMKPNQDRVALKVLTEMGLLAGKKDEGDEGGPGLHLSPEGEKALIAAIEQSDRVEEIHGETIEVGNGKPE